MRRALAALTLLTARAANIASELEAFVDAAASSKTYCATSRNPAAGKSRTASGVSTARRIASLFPCGYFSPVRG